MNPLASLLWRRQKVSCVWVVVARTNKPPVRRGLPAHAMGKSSVYRGVTLFKPTQKWRAQISANGKTISLGCVPLSLVLGTPTQLGTCSRVPCPRDHESEEAAARAFDAVCIHRSGLAANTNWPLSDYLAEIEQLQATPFPDLVMRLRARANGGRFSGRVSSSSNLPPMLIGCANTYDNGNSDGGAVHAPLDIAGGSCSSDEERSGGSGGSGSGGAMAPRLPELHRPARPAASSLLTFTSGGRIPLFIRREPLKQRRRRGKGRRTLLGPQQAPLW